MKKNSGFAIKEMIILSGALAVVFAIAITKVSFAYTDALKEEEMKNGLQSSLIVAAKAYAQTKKEEIKEEKKEEEKEILPSQKTENPVKNHNKITIEKVPNTMENQKFYGAYYLFLFCILKICQKQK